jgi:probable rRNA maturation factor
LDCPDGELSILIVDDLQIEALNKRYLNRSGPTNVIAFPMREGRFSNITPQLLGDVVISVEAAMREGEPAKISMEDRFDQLLIHGILHLFGYDHEKSKEEADKMENKSNELLGVLSNKC